MCIRDRITSTLLSLLVVPAVFTYIDDLEGLLKRLRDKLRRHKHAPAPASAPATSSEIAK